MKGASINLKIHIVQKGETLWEIAKKYGVDFEQLKQLNTQLSSPDMIMPGMKIKIPSTTKTVKKEVPVKKTKLPKDKATPSKLPKELKPITIKEDDVVKKKEVKPQLPKMPEVPQLPQLPPTPQLPSMMQVPKMEQAMNQYTTINFPKMMPSIPKEKEKPVMKEKQKPPVMPMMPAPQLPQPMCQPMYFVPICCHMIHPCCSSISQSMPSTMFHSPPSDCHKHWKQKQSHLPKMEMCDESMEMPEKPKKPMKNHKPPSLHQMGCPKYPPFQYPMSGHGTSYMPPVPVDLKQQPPMPMPPLFHPHVSPTPSGYPPLRNDEDTLESE